MRDVFLKVSSSFLVGGEIAKPGDVVNVPEAEAKDLLHRGKATLATADDEPNQAAKGAEQEPAEAEQSAPDVQANKPAAKSRKAK